MRGLTVFQKPSYREISPMRGRPMRGRPMRGPPVYTSATLFLHLCNNINILVCNIWYVTQMSENRRNLARVFFTIV